MVLLLPVGLYWGLGALRDYQSFQEASALYENAAGLLHQGKASEATEQLERAVEIYPKYYAAWEDLAVCYHMQKDLEKSLSTYQRAVEILPDDGDLQREYATACHYAGMHEKELKHARLAMALPNRDEVFTARVLERAERESKEGVEKLEVFQDNTTNLPPDHSGHDH